MLVLQSYTDSLQVLPGSSGETFPTSSDGACNFNNTEVQEDVVVIEEGFMRDFSSILQSSPTTDRTAVHTSWCRGTGT